MMDPGELTEEWQSLVYCTGLENRRTFTGTGGSNPSSSAEGPVDDIFRAFLISEIHRKDIHRLVNQSLSTHSDYLPKVRMYGTLKNCPGGTKHG